MRTFVALAWFATGVWSVTGWADEPASPRQRARRAAPEADAGSDPPEQPRPGERRERELTLPDSVRHVKDVEYAKVGDRSLQLDLLVPTKPAANPVPLILFIHGGGWENGDKSHNLPRFVDFVRGGHYVCASIDYRLVGEAIWPAAIHDCKAAIRWLRANAGQYGADPNRIGVIGPSAGGHLVALLGTAGDGELEGDLGVRGVSSRPTCVVALCGPSDLNAEFGPVATEKITTLLGKAPSDDRQLAAQASPVTYVSADDPPFLIAHSRGDKAVPFEQSEILAAALRKAGVDVVLAPVEGEGHGATLVGNARSRIVPFFDRHLRGLDVPVSDEPITGGERRQRE